MSGSMENVILIGAGHIGAMSDLHSSKIDTYAKFFSTHPNSNVCVIEPNKEKAALVADRYGFNTSPHYNPTTLSKFSLAVIASPSHMHFQQLSDCINAEIPKIICEKPIFTEVNQFHSLRRTFRAHNNVNIFTNYPRTFLPEFSKIKNFIKIRKQKSLIKVQIRYQRGFLNNCSHAFNLISFILDTEIDIRNFRKTQLIHDHFVNDPTISGFGYWDDTLFEISGVPYAKYSFFEIDIYFEKFRLLINNCGRTIRIFEAEQELQHIQSIPNTSFSETISEYSAVLPILGAVYGNFDKHEKKNTFEKNLSETVSLLKIMEG